MSELSASAGSEGYGASDDAGDWGAPQQAANRPAPQSGDRTVFRKCVRTCPACRFLGFHNYHNTKRDLRGQLLSD